MIKGNAYDAYTVHFEDGVRFSLMATHTAMARIMAQELHPASKVTVVLKEEEWDDDH